VTANPAGAQSFTTSVPFNVANLTTSANPFKLTIDRPATGATLTGNNASVAGWALSGSATINSLRLSVDGIFYGTATYGSSRPDVCVLFAGQAGCPNVGWSESLDTTRFTNGTHTLEATAINSSGQSATVSVSFNVSNSTSGAGRVFIDQPGASSGPFLGIAKFGGFRDFHHGRRRALRRGYLWFKPARCMY
jgi:hypothetical protein